MSTELDTFETRLLAELRQHIAEDSSVHGDAKPTRGRTMAAWIGAAAAAAVIAVGAAVFLPGMGSSSAYSLGRDDSGTVTVEIHRPDDADGLERALEAQGIHADITYLPDLQVCAAGRYTSVVPDPSGIMVAMGETADGESSVMITLPRGAVQPDQTFVFEWSRMPMHVPSSDSAYSMGADFWPTAGDGGFSSTDNPPADEPFYYNAFFYEQNFGVASGPVAPCEAEAAPRN